MSAEPSRTLLVPVDFSTCSMLLLDEATKLALPLGARIVLLHVADLPAGIEPGTLVRPDGVTVRVEDHLASDSRSHLAPFADAVARAGVAVETMVRPGPVVQTIHDVTAEIGADMVVMGTHGRSGLARAVLGSVAEQVVRLSDVPVLLVRRHRRPECSRASCDWCTDNVRSPAEERLRAELDG